MIIYPAIDIIDGQCVRLYQGDFDTKTIYHHNPLTMAKQFAKAGLTHLHLVDLDGAKARRVIHDQLAISIAKESGLIVDFGGGISQLSEVDELLKNGVNQVNIGSLAVKRPKVFAQMLEKFGPDRIILSADVKEHLVAIHGWMENSEMTIWDFLAAQIDLGVEYCTITDIAKDGAMQGPSVHLYREVIQKFPGLKLIASGGVTSMTELKELKHIGCYGAIVGKAIYEQTIPLNELAEF